VDFHAQLNTVSSHRLTDEQLMAIAVGAFKADSIDGEVVSTLKKLKAL
jgi:hypothetical protein